MREPDSSHGSTITLHASRTVRVYQVSEAELQAFGADDVLPVCAAGFLLGLSAMSDNLLATLVGLSVGFIFAIVGVRRFFQLRKMVDEIKERS